MNNNLLTVTEVARILKVTEHTVRLKCRSGALPAVKVLGQWRIRCDRFQLMIKGDDNEQN